MAGHMGSGRVLMAVGSNSSDMLDSSLQHNQTALELPVNNSLLVGKAIASTTEGSDVSFVADNFSDQGKVVSQGWLGGRMLEAGHVEPFKSVVLRPSNKNAEVQALQGLKVTPTPSTATNMWIVHCSRVISLPISAAKYGCLFAPGISVPRDSTTHHAALYALAVSSSFKQTLLASYHIR